ncbi:MAG: epoxyqueuosine reductase QueH [Bacteroidaceae bacterium]|nr:epoxyqueuosine reductase QueH [Bacteroidaceae bacterium]MBR4783181.1 epoxyqueuosine reductase QueH [Bacteroidaceae bacterium]
MKVELQIPQNESAAEPRVLLHSCCAPCSAAIVECMLNNGIVPTVYFSNSNIYPEEEYLRRRTELERHLANLGVPYVEDDYDHAEWLSAINGLEHEPERGARCLQCFKFRLLRAARYAVTNGFTHLTTTLASSRWKNINQINEAGQMAVADTPNVLFWPQNWRKGGLQDRRNELLHLYQFYNQQYCGCEFSIRNLNV